jgi:hypothetical protein
MRFSNSSCKPDRKFYYLKKVIVMKIFTYYIHLQNQYLVYVEKFLRASIIFFFNISLYVPEATTSGLLCAFITVRYNFALAI